MFFSKGSQPEYETERCLTKPDKIEELLTDIRLHKEIIEINIDEDDKSFFTSILEEPPPVPGNPEKGKFLFVAPLEPALGNGRLRLSKKVSLNMTFGMRSFSAQTTFVRSEVRDGTPMVQLDFPERVDATQGRQLERAPILPQYDVRADITLKRKTLFTGEIADISGNGAMVENLLPESELPVSSLIFLDIYAPNVSKLDAVQVHGEVRRHLRVREGDNKTRQYMGVRFLKFSKKVEKMAAYLKKAHDMDVDVKKKHIAKAKKNKK